MTPSQRKNLSTLLERLSSEFSSKRARDIEPSREEDDLEKVDEDQAPLTAMSQPSRRT